MGILLSNSFREIAIVGRVGRTFRRCFISNSAGELYGTDVSRNSPSFERRVDTV